MQTSIKLQDFFSYSFIPLIIAILLIIAITYYRYSEKRKAKPKIVKNEVKVIPEKNIKNIPVIKNKYLKQLEEIENKYNNKIIDLRKAYQLVSESIRMFVFEITDITTQNYSLLEIKKLNMPELYELIKEYYKPEFASKSVGDFQTSINKARRIINEWK